MKNAMRRVLRRAGWSLVATSGLGLGSLAMGQVPVAHPDHSRGVSTPLAGPTRPGELTEARLFLEQIKIELAWLADPVTFPNGIAAYCSADGVELRGYVASEAVRRQALRIAREQTALPLWDELKVHAPTARREPCTSPETLERERGRSSGRMLRSARSASHAEGAAGREARGGRQPAFL